MAGFAVGYQLAEEGEEPFVELVRDYQEVIDEVYFPWVGAASGRAALGRQRGLVDWTAQARLETDLKEFRAMGKKLDLLFNANCYGGRAVSQHLENEVGSILTHLDDTIGGMDVVTTASPAVAHTVKTYFPAIEVRASVNMRIGTVEAMGYVADLFDSYYLQRDLQRDIGYVREIRCWCDANGKKLCMLANSGCLRHCPGQSFHDNMVAHDSEIDEQKNIEGWTPHVCWSLYRNKENWPAILQATWIRPEDLHHYRDMFDIIKLATRMHEKPRMVIHAYANARYSGNMLDLLEPGLGPAFAPHIIPNSEFPADWYAKTSTCDRRCHKCDYCEKTLEQMTA